MMAPRKRDGRQRTAVPPHPVTPDGRYFVVRGRLWRTSNPALPEHERRRLVRDLSKARSDVRQANLAGDDALRRDARRRVQAAKVALGERGPVWWDDGAPDFNRHMAKNTPYADWYAKVAATGGAGGGRPGPDADAGTRL